MHARHQFIFQAHCPPICFWSAKPILLTKTYFMFANFFLGKQTTLTLKRDIRACHLYINVFFSNKSSALHGNRSLEWKCFLVTVKKNDPGVWAVYGASRHVKGVEKDDGGVTSRFNCLHKTAHTLLTNGNISKRTCFCPFSFRFFMFSTAKLGEIVVHKQLWFMIPPPLEVRRATSWN